MYRFGLPFRDTYLLFNPLFGGLPAFLRFGVIFLVLGLLVGLIVWLYRSELRLISARAAQWLLALRVVVLGLLWLVIALRPLYGRQYSEDVPGRVLVALDRSDSMGVTDPQRTPLEKLELARALHFTTDLCDDGQLDAWIAEYRAGRVPSFRNSDGTEDTAHRRIHDHVMQRIDQLPRRQIAEQVLSPDGLRLLQAIRSKHAVEMTGFTQEIGDLPNDPAKLRDALAAAPKPGANFTDLGLPLNRALERSGPNQAQYLGVVVLTDGQHNWGGSPVGKTLELGVLGLPVYPIAIGAKEPPTDIAVSAVKANSTVFKNTDASVEARVHVNHVPAGKVRVTLNWPEVPGQPRKPPLVETIDHDGTSHAYTVRFQARMEDVGTHALVIKAEQDPNAPLRVQDQFPENNAREVRVNVAPDKAKVLLIDGEARWEYHYLATALARDPTMDVQSVVFEQPRVGAPEAVVKRLNLPAQKLPADPDALMAYDCIILGDVTPEQLPPAERERLERYVGERGGTLVILAGKRSMPLEYSKTEPRDPAKTDPLAALLPIREPRVVAPVKGFPVTLTEEGRQTAFLKMESDPAASLERWAALPHHYWAVVGKAKEGAVPLAFYNDGTPARDEAAQRERERANSLVVRQNYGFGRVVYVGIDSTWRWRYKTGDLYHHRFWGQVIRWAATDRPLVTGNDYVRFGTREAAFRSDQEVDLLVRLGDGVQKLTPEALAGARLIRVGKDGKPDEQVALVPLKLNPANPRELNGQVRDLPPGDYAVELAIDAIDDKLNGPDGKKLRAKFQVTPPDSAEMVELGTNWPLLEELAAKTNGKVFAASEASALIDLLSSQSAKRTYGIEQKLWQSWWTLAILLGLLTIEWAGRKLAGLP